MSGWEGARWKPVKRCLKAPQAWPGRRGGWWHLDACQGQQEQSWALSAGAVWCHGEAGGVAQSWAMRYEGLVYTVTANESCVPACPARRLVICISNQPRESLLRQGQKAFRAMLCN